MMQKPELIGLGATIQHYSDRTAGTIIAVERINRSPGYRITVQEDHAHVKPGTGGYGAEVYTYERNPEGRTWTFVWREGFDHWRQCYKSKTTGRWGMVSKKDGDRLAIGIRNAYRDPSF